MASRLDKSTVVPIGIAVSVAVTLLFGAIKVTSDYVRLETKVLVLERNYQVQSSHLGELRSQIQDLNQNMVRLSEIIKRLEEKIK